MATKPKAAPVPLALFIHARRMSWDSRVVFFDLHVERYQRAADDDPFAFGDMLVTKCGRIRIRDMAVVCIVDNGRMPTGIDRPEYRDVHSVDANDAESMVRSLKAVNRALDRLRDRLGSPESFAAGFRRLCDVLGVIEVRFSPDAAALAKCADHAHDANGVARYAVDVGSYRLTVALEAAAGKSEDAVLS